MQEALQGSTEGNGMSILFVKHIHSNILQPERDLKRTNEGKGEGGRGPSNIRRCAGEREEDRE